MQFSKGLSVLFCVPEIGVEPIRMLLHWYLKPARLPFRHPGFLL